MKFKKTKLVLLSALAMQASFSMAGMQGHNPFEGFKTMSMEERREAMRERFMQMREKHNAMRATQTSAPEIEMPETVEATPVVDMPVVDMPVEATPVIDIPVDATPVVDMPETEETPEVRGEELQKKLQELFQQYRKGEITREEFKAARNELFGIDFEVGEETEPDEGQSSTTESVSTTGTPVTGSLVAQCDAGQFAVKVNVTPETNCTLSQTVKIGDEESTTESEFAGPQENTLVLPADSIASIAVTLSCSNVDGTFGGSANASTQSGCTASFPQVDPEMNAERLQMSLESALKSIQESVEADKAKLAEMEAAGEDTEFFKNFLVSGSERSVENRIRSISFRFERSTPAEELDAAIMSFKTAAMALIATI